MNNKITKNTSKLNNYELQIFLEGIIDRGIYMSVFIEEEYTIENSYNVNNRIVLSFINYGSIVDYILLIVASELSYHVYYQPQQSVAFYTIITYVS